MHSDNVSTTATMTRDRKSTKPIMEKRRRARINASLAELKSLLLEVIKREGARHSKMEKADILEMTVKHLREIQKHSSTGPPDVSTANKHRLGFSECTQEVSRFLSNIDGCDVELRTRLLDHLANVVCGTEAEKSPPSPITTPLPVTSPLPVTTPPLEQQSKVPHSFTSGDPLVPQSPAPTTSGVTDLNNNISTFSYPPQVQSTRVVSGLQVIPTKLQNGEIAFVLPGNIVGNNQVPNYIIPVYASPNSSPVKPAVAMATGTTTPGSFMTIVPSSDVFQTCAITPGSIGIMSQPVSTPSSVSSGSSSDYTLSTPVRHDDTRDVRHINDDVKEISHVRDEVKDVRHIYDDANDLRHVNDNVKGLRHVNDDVKEVRHHHNDVRDSVEIYRRHSYQLHEPVVTVWRPW